VQGSAPRHVITKVTDVAEGPIARRIEGRMVVPCYLDQPGCPTGSRFALGPDGNPRRLPGNETVYEFTCNIPRRALDPANGLMRASLYGHGLFGSQGEIDQGQLKDLANEHGFVFCAVDWNGMSFKDVPNAATVLQDLSRFPTLVDHVQQGYLGFLYLGRAMIHPDGFSANPAFRFDGRQVLDPSALFYDGNSQGGIYGGALLAVAPDHQRAGIASRLLDRAVAEIAARGVPLAVIGTGGDDGHAPARALYERHGFTGLPLVRYYRAL